MSVHFSGRVDRSKLLAAVPCTAANTKVAAESTLRCKDDVWGTLPDHYRWVNQRGPDGRVIQNAEGKPEKVLRLIGQPHIEWVDHYVKIRSDEDHFKWYKHWPEAVSLYHFGKLAEEAIPWVKAEGTERYLKGLVPIHNTRGQYTLAIRAMLKLGVLREVDRRLVLESDTKTAVGAVAAVTEAVAVK